MRKYFKSFPEISTSVVMSLGIGLTAVISGFIQSSSDLNSFMFGSIVAISDFELIITAILSIIVIAVTILLYKELFFITFDEEAAMLAGVPVKSINIIIMLLTAVTVSVASRIVGALMISSMLVIPSACAILIGRSYKSTVNLSIVLGEIFTVGGLTASFYLDVRPGGSIVLLGTAVLIGLIAVKNKK